MKKKWTELLLALSLLLSLAAWAALPLSQTYRTTAEGTQIVRVFADHTLGEVESTLHSVAGSLTFDPAAPTNGLTGRFTVPTASFDSGLGLRDRDMRENYLEVAQYPEAVFVMEAARPTLLDASRGDTLRLAVTGRLTLHGVTREHPVQAILVPTADGYRVLARFRLLLTEYGIRPPKRFLMGVKDEIRIEVDLHLKRDA